MFKKPLSTALFGLTVSTGSHAFAERCSAEKIQEILQPATPQNKSVNIDCSVTLPLHAKITKQLIFQGDAASHVVFNGNGAEIQAAYATPSILIQSERQNQTWQVPQQIQIKNCRINGSLRIHGLAVNGESKNIKESSLTEGHTARVQHAAPHHIVLDNLSMIARDNNMMYFAPGAHHITLKNSKFEGKTSGLALYLDAETADNLIENNTFNVQTNTRETIAVDGSANNKFQHNTFIRPNNGAIYLYRNCGEGGTIRHQTPSGNLITQNRFELSRSDKLPVIWIASRNGHRNYCDLDQGYAFGSSINNDDLAQYNSVTDNTFVMKKMSRLYLWLTGKRHKLVRVNAQPNSVTGSRIVN